MKRFTLSWRMASTAALIGLHVVQRILICLHSYAYLPLNSPVVTDAYYYFNIARNIAAGRGLTHDLTTLTNGFQPLYQFLLVPLFLVVGDPFKSINAALLLSVLAWMVSICLLYRLLAFYYGSLPALLSAAIWSATPVVTRNVLNGMETSLAICLSLALLTFYFLRLRRHSLKVLGTGQLVLFGLLGGLLFLARVDGLLLLALIGIDYLVFHRLWRQPSLIPRLFISVLMSIVVTLPWLLYSAVFFHSLLPASGAASRLIADATIDPSSVAAIAANTQAALFAGLVDDELIIGVFRIVVERLTDSPLSNPEVWLLISIGAGLLVLFLGLPYRRSRRALNRLLVAYVVILLLVYLFAMPVQWFYVRYFAFFTVIFAVAYAAVLKLMLRRYARLAVPLTLAVLVFQIGALRLHLYYLEPSQPDPRRQVVIDWIRLNTDPDRDTIGIFQAEVIPYYIQNRFVNLDGKCNIEAFTALKEHRIFEFIRQHHINYLADRKDVFDILLYPRSRGDVARNLKLVAEFHEKNQDWLIYQVLQTQATDSVGRPDN